MSVQAGVYNFDDQRVEPEFLARISEAVKEYGSDGEFFLSDGPVEMLYRPFHTTSESRLEHQPYVSESGKVILWDGRLDNRDELIAQLWDNHGAAPTDLAIVGAAFERWGTDSLPKFLGDWALSIWNPRDKELILAVDYMGIRPLFFYERAQRIIWCSHLAPLALSGDRFSLCDEYIAGYLAFHPDENLTPYREIHRVPPGKFVLVRHGTSTIRTYWSFNTRLRTHYKTDAEYEEHYRYLLRQAVRRRLRTDSPILADLSGGLDSSSMVCMADDIFANEGAEAPRLDTFSYFDSNEPGEDDFEHLITVEDKRGRRGFRVDLKGTGDSLSLDSPTFSATPGFGIRTEAKSAISEIVRRDEYRVVLSGLGGDEVNGQPLDPRIQMADLLIQFRFAELSRQLVAWSLLIRKRPLIHLFFQTLLELLPGSVRARLTARGDVEPWINRHFARKYRLGALQLQLRNGLSGLRPSVRDAVQTVNSLAQVIAYGRPSLLEKRYPYLDQTLLEFLLSIPLDQVLRPGQRRFLMRRALAGLLPPEILHRKTKTCAARCYPLTLEKNWENIEKMLLSPLSCRLGYVDRDRFREALLAMKHGQVTTTFIRLLRGLCLEVWLRDVEARGIVSTEPSMRHVVGMELVESKV